MFIEFNYDFKKNKAFLKSGFLDNIREHFSEKDEKAGLKKKITGRKFFPDRKYAISVTGHFEIGLVVEIIKYLKTTDIPFQIIFTDDFKSVFNSEYNFKSDKLVKLNMELRDYQELAIKKAISNGKGIILSPTASGKTLIMANLIETIRKNDNKTKSLIITLPHLVEQTYNDFIEYGINEEILSKWDGENDLNKDSKIIITNSNILYSKTDNVQLDYKKNKIAILGTEKLLKIYEPTSDEYKKSLKDLEDLKKDQPKILKKLNERPIFEKFFNDINLLIVDEIHFFKKNSRNEDIFDFIKTKHRFSFTATLPNTLIDQWSIIGKTGPIIHEVPRQDLIDKKYISDVEVKVLLLLYKDIPDYFGIYEPENENEEENTKLSTYKYEKELEFIQSNNFRNIVIKKISEKLNKNTLIILDRLEHASLVYEKLKKEMVDKQVFLINGEVETVVREEIKKTMEKEDNVVCIAIAKIFSTGVSINNLHNIILASTGKSKERLIQVFGRSARLHSSKKIATIYDISSNLKYEYRHLLQRLELYKQEDFKYEIFKLKEANL